MAGSILLALAIGFGDAGPALAADQVAPVRSLTEKRHENVVLQQWELSCAAAALATILRYQYGMAVTERSVALGLINRNEYIANPDLVRLRNGFSLLDLKRYVDEIGYEGIGLGQLAVADLIDRAPVIVPVSVRGYPHFVVFRGATSDRVLLADPAFGNVTMSIVKFAEAWIDYRKLGRVGFVVTRSGTLVPPGRLRARASDFVFLR
ncbi:MAG: C39 family peptidase [Burkholderiales bacterium]|jgi:predicted double-glycine peptidase